MINISRFRTALFMLLTMSLLCLYGCASRQAQELPVLLLPQKGYVALPELRSDMGGIMTDNTGIPKRRCYFAVAILPSDDVFDHSRNGGSGLRNVRVTWSDGATTDENISGAGAVSGSSETLNYRALLNLQSNNAATPTSLKVGRSRFKCKIVPLKEFREHLRHLNSSK